MLPCFICCSFSCVLITILLIGVWNWLDTAGVFTELKLLSIDSGILVES